MFTKNNKTSGLKVLEERVNKLTMRLWAGIFLFILIIITGIFLLTNHYYEQYAKALTGSYGKVTGDTLTATEWNTLATDFVDKSGDTMTGNLTVPDVCDTLGNCLSNVGSSIDYADCTTIGGDLGIAGQQLSWTCPVGYVVVGITEQNTPSSNAMLDWVRLDCCRLY